MAILLVFVELGFFYAVPQGGLLLYDNMRFDLLLASDRPVPGPAGTFPLSQLERVRASPDVQEATPIYFGFRNGRTAKAVCGRIFLSSASIPRAAFSPPKASTGKPARSSARRHDAGRQRDPADVRAAEHRPGRRDRRSQGHDRRADTFWDRLHGSWA